jgi:CheY-like chemotaxis protein
MSHDPETSGPPRARILVVDDDEATLRALAGWLSFQYEVITAHDGIEALERAAETPPDVIITDVWMPRLDGVAMVRRMKQTEELKHVPVLFLTGQTTPASVVAGIAAGARAYLPKPVDLDVLDRKVLSALQGRA